ncbi:MAG: sugar phosphate isomerase/epimerase [Planctomycetota bacterium]|nr:sugar phosphate isomerase/epimerase [Planctomycetota bacterium]
MTNDYSRRTILQMLFAGTMGALGADMKNARAEGQDVATPLPSVKPIIPNRISVAQWSFHRMFKSGELSPLDFASFAHKSCGVMGVEYVNSFYKSLPLDGSWVAELKKRADDIGVTSVLIMCDREGDIGDPDVAARRKAVMAHQRWLDAAATLGCHSIRVNARSVGSATEQAERCSDGLRQLCAIAAPMKLNVIVENHGGLSCDGEWVASVIRATAAANCGTLPDFGNFTCADGTKADRYAGVKAMMPFAKSVSAKSHEFNANGEEINTDYPRMMGIVRDAGYRGWIGVEYEGEKMGEVAGTNATRDLLLKQGCVL